MKEKGSQKKNRSRKSFFCGKGHRHFPLRFPIFKKTLNSITATIAFLISVYFLSFSTCPACYKFKQNSTEKGEPKKILQTNPI